MSVQVRYRREAASFLASFVGAQGEMLIDTTNKRVQVHDGTTPGGFPAAKLAEVITNARTLVADASYAALAGDRNIAITSLTAARTITLPTAASYPTGTQLLVFDESGACSATNAIAIASAGGDTINGAAGASIAAAYGYLALESNGATRWTITDQTASSSGGGAPAANSVTNAMLAKMSTLTLKANIAGGNANPVDSSFSAIADAVFGATRGQILYRGASGWAALAPGASGSVLTSSGAGADPAYQAVTQPQNNYAAAAYPTASNDGTQGYVVGSRWLLPATGEMFFCRAATAGAAIWNRADNADFFGYVAGRWYVPFGVSAVANAGTAPGTGVIRLFPWVNKQRVTLAALGVRVQTVSAGGNVQAALYAANPTTKQPTGTPLAATAAMSTATAAPVSAAVSMQIDPGLYWLATNCDNATAAFVSLANSNLSVAQVLGSASEAGASGYTTMPVAFSYAQTFGSWPDLTGNAVAETTSNVQATPLVHFNVASVP